jgi:hypothetical protein
MNQARMKAVLMFTLVCISLGQANPAFSDSKGNSKKISTSTPATPKSVWVQPSIKEKNPYLVQAGRAVPIKFTLVSESGPLLTTDMVEVKLIALSSCSSSVTTNSTSTLVLAKPTPMVSPSTTPTPVASSSAGATPITGSSPLTSPREATENERNLLLVEKGTFSFTWKVAKNQLAGCYRLVAAKGELVVMSPILKVKSGK